MSEAEENQLPADDGERKFWCWTTPQHPRYVRVAEVPLTRDEAIQRLRDQRPSELGDASHVELAIEDLLHFEPITPVGTVRVTYTQQEQFRRFLGSAIGGGFTVNMPGRQG